MTTHHRNADAWLVRLLLLGMVGLYGGTAYCAWLRPLQGDEWAALLAFSFCAAVLLLVLAAQRYRRALPSLWWLATRWD